MKAMSTGPASVRSTRHSGHERSEGWVKVADWNGLRAAEEQVSKPRFVPSVSFTEWQPRRLFNRAVLPAEQ